ncbi:hypothetical protein OSB04_007101 [Centaurea solstitialis]|uniref:Myb/SANT-like domain-containing protein n=1 Tax=Centaurea solstitialis TaxID=347529 RepID=A0AA38TUS4_9ASTR|nr:hypothetical protein OSB04_007101 [Centaurea solstitialis]
MEQTGDSQQPKRTRISCKNMVVVKMFLKTCIFEIALNGKERGSQKSNSWKKVSETLKTFIILKLIRSKYGKYGAWLKLKNKTGNVYDPSTNSFNLTTEQWELEIQSNKYVESLRTTNLPFPDLCTQLFEGNVSTGIGSFGPLSNDLEPSVEPFFVSKNNEEMEISNS